MADANPIKDRLAIARGVLGAVVCWAVAMFGGEALRAPFAFGAVTAAAMGVIGGQAPVSAGRMSQRLAVSGSILLPVLGIAWAVANPVRLPAACSFAAVGIITLAQSPESGADRKSLGTGPPQADVLAADAEPESERRGVVGP